MNGADDERTTGADAAAEQEVEILGFGDDAESAEPVGAAPDLDTLRGELEALKERNLRLLADFDNFRKRGERERDELARYAAAETLRELLPVFDNIARAAAAEGSIEDLRRGVEMVTRQLREVLRRFGVREIEAVGARFDPKIHEAVSREESDAVEYPTVTAELQRGYFLHDRLLRPALVRVAVPHEAAAAGESAEGAG